MKAITETEVEKVLSAAKSARDRAMFFMAFRHGMRASEVCGLETRDLNLNGGWIRVRRVKGSLTTVQPLMKREIRLLEDWFIEREKMPYKSRFVFLSQKSERIDRSQFFRIFRVAAEKAGLPPDKRHPHVLKHALGYMLAMKEVHVETIRHALGHRSLSGTMVYIEIPEEVMNQRVEKALAKIDAAFDAPAGKQDDEED